MEHLLFRQTTCAVFLLLLGGARYYFAFTGTQPARSGSAAHWTRHVPAYFASTVWTIYVAWLVFFPERVIGWDRWPLGHSVSDLLSWIAIPLLGAGFWLFWYGHRTIGRYWGIRIQLKKAHCLVTHGPYRHVRHPLYTALFLGYLGTLLALQSWLLAAWFPVFVASYFLFAMEEESMMKHGFGEAYRAYRRHTGMFLPTWTRIRADIAGTAARVARTRFKNVLRTHDDE